MEDSCKLTDELLELAEREMEMLERGVKMANLAALRRRILVLYLQYVRTPHFNPGARRFTKLPPPESAR